MEMPRPTEKQEKMHRLVGRWRGEEKLFPSPWDPEGGTAVGRVDNRCALDGFVVLQDYEQERNGAISFRGHGVFSWNSVQQCYIMHWFDSMGTPVNEYKGDFEGPVLTLSCDMPQGGKSRAVFDFGPEGKYGFRMEISQDGEQWSPFMEGLYSREDSPG